MTTTAVRQPVVIAVSARRAHSPSKTRRDRILLIAGHGVDGDAHAGATVQHRSRVRKNPNAPNLRQVHLIHSELHEELRATGLHVAPGVMGENITTAGVELLALSTGTQLHIGKTAVVEVTGLRNPCSQLDSIQPGLMAASLDRDAAGNLIRKAGVMGIVVAGGEVRPGDEIRVKAPPFPRERLRPV